VSTVLSTGPQVFRGLPAQAAPLRLAGARAAALPASGTAAVDPEAEALRLGREEGWRAGHEQGLRSGQAQGLEEGRARAAEALQQAVEEAVAKALLPLRQEQERVCQLATALADAMDDALAAAHDEMLALCFETIARVLGERAIEPQALLQQFDALRGRHGWAEVVLRVHPQDAQRLQRAHAAADAVTRLRWTPDPEVAWGGCILQAPGGGLDARLETILLACKTALLQARAGLAAQEAAATGATP
jgi:flagellar assembly protein FliH